MDQQLKLWLAPPIIMGIAYIYFRLKIPLAWSWGSFLQGFLLIVSGACGYLFGPEWLYVALSWTLFCLFLIAPKVLMLGCDQCVSMLNSRKLFFYSRFFPCIYWGKLGLFWRDLYLANAYALDGNATKGKSILDKWRNESLPSVVDVQLNATSFGINLILFDWDGVIDEYNQRIVRHLPVSVGLSVQTARAFSEKHNFDRAAQCFEASRLAETKTDPTTLAFVLLPFFCLSGQKAYAEQLMIVLKGAKRNAPEFLLLYWQARLQVALGNTEEARYLFAQSLDSSSRLSAAGQSNYAVWQSRIEQQLEHIDDKFDLPAPDVLQNIAARVWRLFADTNFVSAAILPQKASPAVVGLCALLILAYVMSGCVDMVASSWAQPFLNLNVDFGNGVVALSEKLGNFSFENLLLDKDAVLKHGQYFRLFTYMFLHGNITHLFLNVVGLYWFGRRAASIFSPRSFVFIFVCTGIIAGLAQILFSDIPAIGASGGVLGVFGADFAGIFRLKNRLPQKVRKAELTSMSVLALSQLLLDHVIPKVAGEAHMGGLIAGLLIGCLVPLATKKEPPSKT
jgi:rhomboid protease GluP